jgi:hypothetical protein
MRRTPVLNQRRARRVGARGRDEPTVLVVGTDEALHLAAAQGAERVPVPAVALPADVVELNRAQALRERTERPARLDLGELAVVADQHELGVRVARRVGQRREIARADHAGLVDDQHCARRELHAALEAAPETSDRRRVDPRLVAQFARRARRQPTAEHRAAAPPPRLDCRLQRERLARAGRGTHDLDAIAAARQRRDERTLLVAQSQPCTDRCVDRIRLRDADRRAAPSVGSVEQLPLDPKQRTGRVPRLASLGLELDDLSAREEPARAPPDLVDARAVPRGLRERLNDVATREGRPFARQSLRTFELRRKRRDDVLVDRPLQSAANDSLQPLVAESMFGSAGPPLRPQTIHGHAVLLPPARLERRDLGRPRRVLATRSHEFEDLGPPA